MILNHPEDLQLDFTNVGSNVTFTVNTTNAGFTYQWQKDGNNISDIVNAYSGTTNTTLTKLSANKADSGQYRVRVSSRYGSVLSYQANLTFGKYCAYSEYCTAMVWQMHAQHTVDSTLSS